MIQPAGTVRTPWSLAAAGLGLLAASLGLVALFGWGLDWRLLTSFGHAYIPMAPNTALLFVLLGCAQAALSAWPDAPGLRRLASAAVAAGLVLPVLTLLELATSLNTGVDALLYQTSQTLGRIPVGRMSPVTALTFLAAGAGLLPGRGRVGLVSALALLVFGVGWINTTGYVFQSPLLYKSLLIPLALPTALGFLALGAALLLDAGPAGWPIRLFVGQSTRARLLRWILPPIPLLMLADDLVKALFTGWSGSAEVFLSPVTTIFTLVLVGVIVAINARKIGDQIDQAIARQHQAEQVLRESEGRLRTLFEQAAVGVAQYLPDQGTLAQFNDKLRAILGQSREDMKRLDLRAITSPDDLPALTAAMTRLATGAVSDFSLELRMLRGDNTWIWVNLTASRGGLAGSEPTGHILVLQDVTGRRQAEARGQEAKEEWERTFDTITDLVFIVGADNRIIRANNALCARLDLTPEEVAGRDCSELLGWSDSGMACQTEAILPGKALEITFAKIPGSFLGSRSILKNAAGAAYACVFVISDISRYKSMQAALFNIEEQHRRIIDNAVVGVFQSSLDGALLSVNPAVAAMHGFASPREMMEQIKDIGRQVYAHPEDRKILKDTLGREGQIRDFEFESVRRDGSLFWARLNARIVSEAGVAPHIEGFIQDITEWKLAMLHLTASEARFRSLVETMAQGLVQIDALGIITYSNKHFCNLLQREEKDILGRRPAEFLDEADKQRFEAGFASHCPDATTPGIDATWRNALGNKVFSVISPVELTDAGGTCQGYWLLVMDVTRRKLLESQLLQSQKLEAIGQLAAGIAHEINTPAQYVGSNVQFIKGAFEGMLAVCAAARRLADAAKDSPPRPEDIQALAAVLAERDAEFLAEEVPGAIAQTLEGVERISTIVRSVKQFAHPGAAAMAPADLNEAMQSTATVSRNEWKYVAELDLDLDPDLPLVVCMIGEINQVVLNLIINAAHAIADAKKTDPSRVGRITLSTRKTTPWAEIRVGDTGTGIPEAVQARIFDPFFTTKEVGRGTGQGLTISRTIIVEKHKGQLFFETEEGMGSTFVVRLPLEPSE